MAELKYSIDVRNTDARLYLMTTQMSLLAPYDASKPAPGFAANIKIGDHLMNRRGQRGIVTAVSDNLDGAVFVVAVGELTAVWLQREIHVHIVR